MRTSVVVGRPNRSLSTFSPFVSGSIRGLNVATILSLAFAIAGCEEGPRDLPSGPNTRIRHPNDENQPPPDASSITGDSVPRGLSEEATAAWIAAKRSLLSATPLFRIGSEERGPELFGYVPKADFAPNGNLVVLDEDAQEIRIFDPQGRFVEQFGGVGDGPMELRRARDFHLFPDGSIAVPLGEYGAIKIFERSETRWELSEIVDARSRSLCGMDDGRWFSAAYPSASGSTIINELGDSVRSFGSGYRYDKWYIRRALSGGSVACLDESDRIVYGFEVLPLVQGYATDGSLQWTAVVLEDYLQLRVTESQGPGGTVAYSEGTLLDHDRLMSVFAVGNGDHVLLDYSRVLPDQKEIVQRHYLIDAATGAGAYLGDDALPAVVSVQPDGYVALFAERTVYLEVRRIPAGNR